MMTKASQIVIIGNLQFVCIRRQSESFTETARRFLLTEWPKYKAFVDGLEVDPWSE